MNVLLVTATAFEIAPLLTWLESEFEQRETALFTRGELNVQVLVCGIGAPATAFSLGRYLAVHQPDFAINAGIAGAFAPSLLIGDVVQVSSERWGDLGAEEADGRFIDLNEMGFSVPSVLENPMPPMPGLSACKSLTVNKVHGSAASIAAVMEKYPSVQLENMEGAAFFQACLASCAPFVEIRAISNRVAPRDRDSWDIPLAVNNLNAVLRQMMEGLEDFTPQ
jgi:futalosine nucleosidase